MKLLLSRQIFHENQIPKKVGHNEQRSASTCDAYASCRRQVRHTSIGRRRGAELSRATRGRSQDSTGGRGNHGSARALALPPHARLG